MIDFIIAFIFLMLTSAWVAWRLDWFKNEYSGKLQNFGLLKFMILGAVIWFILISLFMLLSNIFGEFIPQYIWLILWMICYFSWWIILSKIAKKLAWN